jgi:hypothetical protein
MHLIIISIFVFLSSFFSGCKKDHIISENQQILFQCDYQNAAWGFQHEGFYIDNKGSILTYNNPGNWHFNDQYYVLTDKQVKENINKCEVSPGKIPIEELKKYTNLIHNIALSKVSARNYEAYDSGITEFICFQYSELTGTYKGHLIKMEGDITCENLNFFSKKVAAWIRNSGNKTYVR